MDPVPLARLEREWTALQPRLALLYRSWSREEPALARFSSPSRLLAFLRGRGPTAAKDEALAALLRRGRVEPLASRLLLEALLPGLKALARRLLFDPAEREDLWALLLAAAWERISTYPLARRPRKVAANILLDTLADTLALLRAERRRQGAELPRPFAGGVPAPEAVEDDVEALLGEALGQGALRADEVELVLATRFDGQPLHALADEAGVAYNTMKVRRQRAERRLLAFLGYPPVPRGRQERPFSFADAE